MRLFTWLPLLLLKNSRAIISVQLNDLILNYPILKLKKILGYRAFSSAAPNLWKNLPLRIRLEPNFERFKSLLETRLFRLAFDM